MSNEKSADSISSDSVSLLEDVKKGKPRKFAMICKGPAVISLVVYKKGSIENRKKEAKESGKGQFYFGVVDGQGMDIRFLLARADGFEKEPVKSTSLKTFLAESGGFKCKPYFEIVDTIPLVLDEDDPLVARFLKLRQAAVSVCEAHPDRAAEINAACQQIGAHLEQEQSEPATVLLEATEKLLAGLTTDAPKPVAQPNVSQPSVDPGLASKFSERLKSLLPGIKAAAGTAAGDRAKQLAGEAGVFAKKQDFNQANLLLDQVEEALKKSDASVDAAAAFSERLRTLMPVIKDALANGNSQSDAIKQQVGQAGALAKEKNFVQAHQLLDAVESLLKTGAPNTAPTTGNQSPSPQFSQLWEQAKLAWQDALEVLDGQLEKLRQVLIGENDSELKDIAEFGLNAMTAGYRVPLQAAILDLDRATGDAKAKCASALQEHVREFRDHIDTDERVEACDNNPFNVPVTIRATLDPALEQMEQALSQELVA